MITRPLSVRGYQCWFSETAVLAEPGRDKLTYDASPEVARNQWGQHEAIVDVSVVDTDLAHVTVDPYVDVQHLWPELNQHVPMRSFSPLQLGLHELYLNTIEQNNNKSKDVQHEPA